MLASADVLNLNNTLSPGSFVRSCEYYHSRERMPRVSVNYLQFFFTICTKKNIISSIQFCNTFLERNSVQLSGSWGISVELFLEFQWEMVVELDLLKLQGGPEAFIEWVVRVSWFIFRKKSVLPPPTITKVWFSSRNYETGYFTSLNFSNRAFYLPRVVLKAVSLQKPRLLQ